ncbi:Enamine deaminase RidA, house cleaning of reactive enamine intermediates, YjgF/YER057c/UK114 family [Paractinoplanes atraurantiacus]|uniref:Enamine deaminase RidA, house cleaning of reactive enamine intermediates, YjgF/YER057c/UK114 family n=1 Tax=Paractinoplanes atraurantiacus TaxID=1036182 RepID=A0A285K5I9_9ACTN|nr:Enamine deaminase RidA, house cleaning of reactive enamine intermediates, YjgF/YER057c/UK114 family [Actinoplanes atraurantiacus]
MVTVHLPPVPGYAALAGALASAGLGVTDVVHVTEYVTAATKNDLDAARSFALRGHRVPVSRVPIEAVVGSTTPYVLGVTAHPSDGIVYLPSVHTTEGDFRDQYRWCLARLRELAGDATLVRTIDYTATATRADYPRCGRPRRDVLGSVHPAAAGILVDVPVAPGARVALDAVAASGPLRVLNPGWARYDTLTYKPAVQAGKHVFLSGFGALDPVTQEALHDGNLPAQAEHIYVSIETVLAEAGASGEHVTSLVEYVTPAAVEAYPRTKALREKHFPNAAVVSVVCSALLRPSFLLESVPTAVLP